MLLPPAVARVLDVDTADHETVPILWTTKPHAKARLTPLKSARQPDDEIKIIVLSAGGKRRRQKGRRGELASPSPPPLHREPGLSSENGLMYIEHNFTMTKPSGNQPSQESQKHLKDEVGRSLYGPGWRRLAVPTEPAATVAQRAYEPPRRVPAPPKLPRPKRRRPRSRAEKDTEVMEERMPQTPLEPGEPKESEALQEDNLEAALQELDGFEPVEWSEGDEVAQNVDVGAHELLKEDAQPQEHAGSSLRDTFMKILVQVLREEVASADLQRRINHAVEAELAKVLDIDESAHLVSCPELAEEGANLEGIEDADDIPDVQMVSLHKDEKEFEESRRKVAECLRHAAEFNWKDLRVAEKETDDFQRARRKAAESFRQDTEESWLAVSSHTTTKVDPEIASSDLYQVAESLRRAAEDKLLQSERDGLRSQQRTPAECVSASSSFKSGVLSACSVDTLNSSKVGIACEEAVGLVMQTVEDEFSSADDRCSVSAACDVSEEVISCIMLHLEDLLDSVDDLNVVDLDFMDEDQIE